MGLRQFSSDANCLSDTEIILQSENTVNGTTFETKNHDNAETSSKTNQIDVKENIKTSTTDEHPSNGKTENKCKSLEQGTGEENGTTEIVNMQSVEEGEDDLNDNYKSGKNLPVLKGCASSDTFDRNENIIAKKEDKSRENEDSLETERIDQLHAKVS